MEEENTTFKNIIELEQSWNKFAHTYQMHDSAMQTFYYTLIHMIDLPKAKHILEVGCGTGRLLPLAMNLKSLDCTYLASDLSSTMVDLAHENLHKYLSKIGVSDSLHQWKQKNNLIIQTANGEDRIQSPHKFDRIIANLVLHLTQNPVRMMANFHSMSQEGCILAVSVTGAQDLVDFHKFKSMAPKDEESMKLKRIRSSSHMCQRLKEVGEETGWDLITEWSQNTAMVWKEYDESLEAFIEFLSQGNKKTVEFVKQCVIDKLQSKKALNFQAQVAIFRRK